MSKALTKHELAYLACSLMVYAFDSAAFKKGSKRAGIKPYELQDALRCVRDFAAPEPANSQEHAKRCLATLEKAIASLKKGMAKSTDAVIESASAKGLDLKRASDVKPEATAGVISGNIERKG